MCILCDLKLLFLGIITYDLALISLKMNILAREVFSQQADVFTLNKKIFLKKQAYMSLGCKSHDCSTVPILI